MLKIKKKVVGLKQETFKIYSSQSVISAIRLSNYLSSIKYKKVILKKTRQQVGGERERRRYLHHRSPNLHNKKVSVG